MSIRSLAATARLRTAASMEPGGTPQGVWTRAADGEAAPAGTDTLLKAVPTEVVVLYTTIIGVLTGVIKDHAFDTYLPLRWIVYGGCVFATLLVVPIAYHLAPAAPAAAQGGVTPLKPPGAQDGEPDGAAGKKPRTNPVSETFMAGFSFAVWGLVIPGSPLYVMLSSPTLPVVVTVLSASGAFLSSAVFGPWLNRAARTGSG